MQSPGAFIFMLGDLLLSLLAAPVLLFGTAICLHLLIIKSIWFQSSTLKSIHSHKNVVNRFFQLVFASFELLDDVFRISRDDELLVRGELQDFDP